LSLAPAVTQNLDERRYDPYTSTSRWCSTCSRPVAPWVRSEPRARGRQRPGRAARGAWPEHTAPTVAAPPLLRRQL